MQSERLARQDSTISGFDRHLHSQPVRARLKYVWKGYRHRARMLSPGKFYEWPLVHARSWSGILQKQFHEWPILSARSWSRTPTGLTSKKQIYFLRLSLYFPIAYTHCGLKSITLHSHQLMNSWSVHCKAWGF